MPDPKDKDERTVIEKFNVNTQKKYCTTCGRKLKDTGECLKCDK